jgi:predicted ABC-type ATPase
MPAKELVVVAGPNGAGKSTFVARFLHERPCPYLCADSIAKELPHLDPISQQIAAGRAFLQRIEEQLGYDKDFIVETTLSGRTLRNYLHRAQTAGFNVTIYFLYLDSSDLCVARVKRRVLRGGHHVPDQDVRRRFSRSLTNFWKTYRKIADHWAVVYNAGGTPVEVAFGYRQEFAVSDVPLFDRFLKLVEVE